MILLIKKRDLKNNKKEEIKEMKKLR